MPNQTLKKHSVVTIKTKTSTFSNEKENKYILAKSWAQKELHIEATAKTLFSDLELNYKQYLQKNNFCLIDDALYPNELSFFIKIYVSLISDISISTRRTANGILYQGIALKNLTEKL